jgi:hypothetical protein
MVEMQFKQVDRDSQYFPLRVLLFHVERAGKQLNEVNQQLSWSTKLLPKVELS